jgi:hypothetical protein
MLMLVEFIKICIQLYSTVMNMTLVVNIMYSRIRISEMKVVIKLQFLYKQCV